MNVCSRGSSCCWKSTLRPIDWHVTYEYPVSKCQRWWCPFVLSRSQSANIDTDFLIVESDGSNGVEGSSDGSMYGHACASKCISVAAMDWVSDMIPDIPSYNKCADISRLGVGMPLEVVLVTWLFRRRPVESPDSFFVRQQCLFSYIQRGAHSTSISQLLECIINAP